jgi:hypothetical protein
VKGAIRLVAPGSGDYLDAEQPGGLQVDDELEPGRLLDRQVRGLGALEDAAGIDADLTKRSALSVP